MTKRIKSVVLVLSGVVIGCGAAATMGKSWAGPQPGKWSCYNARSFPGVSLNGDATEAMNRIGKSAATGTVITYSEGEYGNPTVCVRD